MLAFGKCVSYNLGKHNQGDWNYSATCEGSQIRAWCKHGQFSHHIPTPSVDISLWPCRSWYTRWRCSSLLEARTASWWAVGCGEPFQWSPCSSRIARRRSTALDCPPVWETCRCLYESGIVASEINSSLKIPYLLNPTGESVEKSNFQSCMGEAGLEFQCLLGRLQSLSRSERYPFERKTLGACWFANHKRWT